MTPQPVYVSVTGASGPDKELDALAGEVGRLLAELGCVVVSGGLGGVMEAASRGARDAGGQVLGIVPDEDRRRANPHCTLVVATGIGQGRNLAVAATGDVMIALGSGWGTLSEIALARKLGRPVVTLCGRPLDGVIAATTAAEAVTAALDAAAG
ncbi:MAG: hypothetical protein QOJ31_1531 [Gaiellales bacterium]|nr:hypothetical protein [Gaiellales bacterium]MDX6546343.1 hypothetical protein [Gaiellales bacterium]MDX6550847.1 hypothetical protein [Gaiellales bacterium]